MWYSVGGDRSITLSIFAWNLNFFAVLESVLKNLILWLLLATQRSIQQRLKTSLRLWQYRNYIFIYFFIGIDVCGQRLWPISSGFRGKFGAFHTIVGLLRNSFKCSTTPSHACLIALNWFLVHICYSLSGDRFISLSIFGWNLTFLAVLEKIIKDLALWISLEYQEST